MDGEQQIRFLARLGAAMCAANYPVTLVRQMLDRTAAHYGVRNDGIALPNHVQVVGPSTAGGTVVGGARVDADLRFDQIFPLARLVSDAMAGRVSAPVGESRLEAITTSARRYPAWVTVIGYGIQSAGLALVLEPTFLNVLAALLLGAMVGGFLSPAGGFRHWRSWCRRSARSRWARSASSRRCGWNSTMSDCAR